MSLTSEIKSIVNTKFPDATYILSSRFKGNVKSFDISQITVAKPLIILDNVMKKRNTINPNLNLTSRTDIKMYFLAKSDINDRTDEELEDEIIAPMELIAEQTYFLISFLPSIRQNQGELFEFDIDKQFRIFNPVLSGVLATARWKYNKVINVCPTPNP